VVVAGIVITAPETTETVPPEAMVMAPLTEPVLVEANWQVPAACTVIPAEMVTGAVKTMTTVF
jgi:hypothetical protein